MCSGSFHEKRSIANSLINVGYFLSDVKIVDGRNAVIKATNVFPVSQIKRTHNSVGCAEVRNASIAKDAPPSFVGTLNREAGPPI